jgi:hypothetical protein
MLMCSYTLPSATNRHPCSTSLRDEHAVKHCRRVATRYDKLAANYLAFVQLASISMWLRVSEYTTSSLLLSDLREQAIKIREIGYVALHLGGIVSRSV